MRPYRSLRWLAVGGVLLAIVLFGTWLRVTAVAETRVLRPFGPDAWQYFHYAVNLVRSGVYSKDPSLQTGEPPRPDAFRSPGYPLFLVPFAAMTMDPSLILDRVVTAQAWISGVAIVLLFGIARSVLPTSLALLAALLTAVTPHLITMNHYLLSESWYTFLLLAALLAMGWGRPWWSWLLVGMFLGMAGLVRPILLPFVGCMALGIAWHKDFPERRNRVLSLVFGFCLLVFPWALRNKIVLGTFGDDTLAIHTTAHGMYPDLLYNGDPQTFAYPYHFDPRFPEITTNAASVLREITERFLREPGRYLKWYLLDKPQWFWSWNIIQGQGDAFVYPTTHSPFFWHPVFQMLHRLLFALHPLLVVLAGLGSLVVWLPRSFSPSGQWPSLFMARSIALLLGSMTALHMIFIPLSRYSIPLRPMIYVMSLFFLWWVYHNLRRWLQPGPILKKV
ncbi:MAG: hypothetical protein HQL74_08555 [Magnetococcales bacterium]|nr:hypothetical protein [Magnetococcales bacterium]